MPKSKALQAILKFHLEFPDQRKAHMRCVKSTEMAIVLFDILHNASKIIESRNPNGSEEFCEGVECTLDYIRQLCEEHYIHIDEIID